MHVLLRAKSFHMIVARLLSRQPFWPSDLTASSNSASKLGDLILQIQIQSLKANFNSRSWGKVHLIRLWSERSKMRKETTRLTITRKCGYTASTNNKTVTLGLPCMSHVSCRVIRGASRPSSFLVVHNCSYDFQPDWVLYHVHRIRFKFVVFSFLQQLQLIRFHCQLILWTSCTTRTCWTDYWNPSSHRLVSYWLKRDFL
jgi:hypothetical protein